MPFLAVDAGNSSVKAAAWDGERWGPVARWPSAPAGADVWAARLAEVAPDARHAGVASVVPTLTLVLAEAARVVTGHDPVVVAASLSLPFRLAYRTPHTLGADRLAAAAAAWHSAGQGGRPVVALDAGTAITVEVVSAEPAYLGGAILPGPDLLRQSLRGGTGQLPDVPWAAPASPIGTSTVEAIQAGLAVLVADGVAGLLRRTAGVLRARPVTVATGGWAPWLAEHVAEIDRVEPALVLDGIRLLSESAR